MPFYAQGNPFGTSIDSNEITDGTIVNADVNASAGITFSKMETGTAGQVLTANASGIPTLTTVSGDITISATGVTAIGSGVIVNADINNSASIAYSKLNLAGSIVNADINASAAISNSKLTYDTSIIPATDDAVQIGSTTRQIADMFIASGGVINWNAGDVTITHAVNSLTFAGASSGYTFNTNQTSGQNIIVSWSASTTLTGMSDGMNVDGDTNVTLAAQTFRGIQITQPQGSTSGSGETQGFNTTFNDSNSVKMSASQGFRGNGNVSCNTFFFATMPLKIHQADTQAIAYNTGWNFDVLTNTRTFPIIRGFSFSLTQIAGAGGSNTITNCVGAYITNPTQSGAGTNVITNLYGVYIEPLTTGGTINVGVYIGGASGGSTTNYGLWVDTGDSAFGGAVLPDTNDVGALGSGTLMWSDLFLASGGVINFDNGDVTITHAANAITVAGGTFNASGGGALTGTWSDMGSVTTIDINGGTIDGATIGGSVAGAITGTTITVTLNLVPDADDGAGLGLLGTAFSDVFLASGAVINFAGDVTVTHSANTLTFAGASSGYTFDAVIGANGTGGMTTTQATFPLVNATATTVNFAGAATTITVGAATSSTTWTGQAITLTGANTTNTTLFSVTNTTNTAVAAHSVIDISVGGTTSVGDPQLRLTIPSGTSWYMGVDNNASDVLIIGVGTVVGTSGVITMTSTTVSPSSSDGASLGTSSLFWSDLFLASGAVINFNSNVTLTHSSNTLSFAGASSGFQFSNFISLTGIGAANPVLAINATSDSPTVSWGASAGNEVNSMPAGYMEINVGGAPRYIPFWA